MKLIFENITTYTPKIYKEFIYFHNDKYGISYAAFTILFSVLFLYCLIMNLLYKKILLSLLFFIIIISFLACRIYLPIKKMKKTLNKQKSKKENMFIFRFYNNYFDINNKRFYYIELHKIFETNDFYYLYLNNEKAALIDKKSFQIGTSKDFSEFIKKKTLFKYNNNIKKGD